MQKLKQLLNKKHFNHFRLLITSAVLITVNLTAFSVKAQTQLDMDKLNFQLQQTVSNHNLRGAINVVDKMMALIPADDYEQRVKLKNYRAELRALYDSKVEPHFYPAAMVDNFLQGCVTKVGEQKRHWCTCFIDKIEDKYTLEQFVQVGLKYMQTAKVSDNNYRDFYEIGASCPLASE